VMIALGRHVAPRMVHQNVPDHARRDCKEHGAGPAGRA
jgi:hypothetical protein